MFYQCAGRCINQHFGGNYPIFPPLCLDDINTGGIVAGVIVALLALALLGFGLWYARRKGYLPSEFTPPNHSWSCIHKASQSRSADLGTDWTFRS